MYPAQSLKNAQKLLDKYPRAAFVSNELGVRFFSSVACDRSSGLETACGMTNDFPAGGNWLNFSQ